MVHHCDSGIACLRCAAIGGNSAAARPEHGNKLLRSLGGRERDSDGAQGRLPSALAAPVLVLRASGGVHRDPARDGGGLAGSLDVLAKANFGYKAMVYAMLAIGFFGFMVWGHHMFMSGMSPYSAFAFSILTMCIGVPSAIKTFNWLGTMWKGHIRFDTPMLYAIGFVSLFVSGGLSGPFLAQPVLDIPLHDTYFVVGHFHLIMGVAAIFGIFAATHYWFPKMFGRMMNETMGRIHFFITLAGTYAIFMPMHYLGMAGQTRRYSQFTEVAYQTKLLPLQTFMTYAAFITIAV